MMKYNNKRGYHRNIMAINGKEITFCDREGKIRPDYENKSYRSEYGEDVYLYFIADFMKSLPMNDIYRKNNYIWLRVDGQEIDGYLQCRSWLGAIEDDPFETYYFMFRFWVAYYNAKVDIEKLLKKFNYVSEAESIRRRGKEILK